MQLNSLKDLYVQQLKDLYSAESQLIDALPKMAKSASTDSLREAFENHLEETRKQKDRIEEIFSELDEKPSGHKCKGMEGLIAEGSEFLDNGGDSDVVDAGLIAAAQRVEHYEIAGYGTAKAFAKQLGEERAGKLLDDTLQEESQANEKLNKIALQTVNKQAPQE
jgi:ferritin-like metal-binding protein YciE